MWALYEAGTLHPASVLTGEFDDPEDLPTLAGVREIEAARLDEERKQAIRAADDAPKGKSDEPPPPWMQ
jgi:RIO kinase 1